MFYMFEGTGGSRFSANVIKYLTAADASQGEKARWLRGTDGLFLFSLTFSGSGEGALRYGSYVPVKLPLTNMVSHFKAIIQMSSRLLKSF